MEKTIDDSKQRENVTVFDPSINSLKDKLFNKIYFYVLISFLLFNWQEIIILLKAKEDIYYTLSVIFTNQHYGIWFTNGIILPAWFAHFGLPLISGLIASVVAPFVTYLTSSVTSKWFARIRREDGLADLEVEKEYQDLRSAIARKTIEGNNLESKNLELQKENTLLLSKNKSLHDQRTTLFYGIKAFVDCYDERNGLHSNHDLVEFIKAVELTDFYKDDAIFKKIPKLVRDLKRMYTEGNYHPETRTNGNNEEGITRHPL